jgi:hypothetical protein
MQRYCRGVLEGRGLIVGGWDDGVTEGHYGVRAWIRARDITRLGVDPRLVARMDLSAPYRAVPAPCVGEARLTPTDGDYVALRTAVTVTREEHYQAALVATCPAGWLQPAWPVLVDLDFAPDPHIKSKQSDRVRITIDGRTVGFLTPVMTERHGPAIRQNIEAGLHPTAAADVRRQGDLWQITLRLAHPPDTEVTLIPAWIVNRRTGTKHDIGGQLSGGTWRTSCGQKIDESSALILCKTRPSGRLVEQASGRAIPWDTYEPCDRC